MAPTKHKPKTELKQPEFARTCGPVFIVLLVGVFASLLLFSRVRDWEKDTAKKQFQEQATPYSQTLEKTLSDYTEALRFLGDHFDHSATVSRKSFAGIVSSMIPRYPGIQTFGWNPLVTTAERTACIQDARLNGYPNFEITERTLGGAVVPAVQRDEYVVVFYLFPPEGNEAAFGYDISSDLVRREAITKAFSSGRIAATSPITLVQEEEDQVGVLMLRPVYETNEAHSSPEERHAARKGLVVEVLRIGKVVQDALIGFDQTALTLTLRDLTAPTGQKYLLDLPTGRESTSPLSSYKEGETDLLHSHRFAFCDREYEVIISPTREYFQAQPISPALVYLVGCMLIVLLLSLYLLGRFQHMADVEYRMRLEANGT